TSATIEWSVNGVMQTPYIWSGSLTTSQSMNNISIGSFNFVLPVNKVKVWTSNPNNTIDENNLNDTLSRNSDLMMSGVYTIGGTLPDFGSFTDAIQSLNNRGVCGPTTFYVREGTYNEKVQINNVTGSSAVNFITFTT